MTDAPFPRYPDADRPRVGLDTTVVLDHAVVALADRRFMSVLDAPAQLHLLASLVAQAEAWLSEEVAAARGQGLSWAVIGRMLGTTATAARQRYAPVVKSGRAARDHARQVVPGDPPRLPLVD